MHIFGEKVLRRVSWMAKTSRRLSELRDYSIHLLNKCKMNTSVAGVQMGYNYKIFSIKTENVKKTFVNAKIKLSGKRIINDEIHLSFKGVIKDVERSEKVTIKYFCINKEEFVTEEYDGIEAILIQQGFDTTIGILPIDMSKNKENVISHYNRVNSSRATLSRAFDSFRPRG